MRARAKFKPITILTNLKNELLEDILYYGKNHECISFYQTKHDGDHLVDYEVASLEEPTLLEVANQYIKDKENHGRVPGYSNILYSGEKYKIISLKDALRIVTELENPNFSTDILITYINMWINNVNSNQLAQSINISRQAMSLMLLGETRISEARKIQIAEVLKFSVAEYNALRTNLIFDETDV